MTIDQKLRKHLNSFRVILLGFAALILIGALILMLPISSADGHSVPFINALFTSTSAVCVTGLVVYDTATQWSLFGRSVILFLIQIGGLGVVTMWVLMMLVTGKRIGIFQRLAMQDAISAPQIGGIIRFTKFFLKGTLFMEGAGILLMLPFFASRYGLLNGLGFSVFHSISAFCNAGFDLMGHQGAFSSFTHYADNAWINTVLMLLIIVGGLGYLTWQDLMSHKFHFRHLRLQSKIILATTGILLLVPFLYFVIFEFGWMPWKERILASLFQAVTPRTAGFNTVQYSDISETGRLITIILMLIGGAPGSTAGGMKVTTTFVLFAAAQSNLHKKTEVGGFRRRIEPDVIANAFTLLMVYLTLLLAGTIVIGSLEHVGSMTAMFECASALGTVGLTVGITPRLCAISKLILIGFMYLGRSGGITIAYAMLKRNAGRTTRLPTEKVTVG